MGKHGEKKVAEWLYDDGSLRIKVPVMMVDGHRQQPHKLFEGDPDCRDKRNQVSTYFRVKMDDPEVYEEDIDINALKTRVMEAVRNRLVIDWKTMILVNISHGRSRLQRERFKQASAVNDEAHVSLSVKWELVQIAEAGGSKQRFHRSFHGAGEKYNLGAGINSRINTGKWEIQWNKPRDGWPEVGPQKDSRWQRDPTLIAMIPDTPANRGALEQIAAALEALAEKLTALLGVDQVEKTLGQIAADGLAGLAGLGGKLLEDHSHDAKHEH